jgi:hypothetical protein
MFIGRKILNRDPFSGRALVRTGLEAPSARRWNSKWHPEDLMKPDLFSEIILLGSGELIFALLLLIVTAALR